MFTRIAALLRAPLLAMTTAVAVLGIGAGATPAHAALVAVGVDDALAVVHDRMAVVAPPGVLANDTGLLGGTTAVLVSDVSHGTLDLRPDGGYAYAPDPGFLGSDSFRYRPSGLLSTTATVRISVTNQAPTAAPDSAALTGPAPLTVAAPGVLGNDADADGDGLTAVLVAAPPTGSLVLDADGGFVFTPGGFVGTTAFTYRASDGLALSAGVSVTLTVSPPPSSPPTAPPSPTPPATSTPTPRPAPALTSASPSPAAGGASPVPAASPRPSTRPAPSPARPAPGAAASPLPTPSAAGVAVVPRGAAPPGSLPARNASGGDASAAPGFGGAYHTGGWSLDQPGLTVEDGGGFGLGQIWFVPVGAVTGPGLLVILWLALQYAAGSIWVPAARRLRGDARRSATPRRPR